MSFWYPMMAVAMSCVLSCSASAQAAQPDLQYRVLGSNAQGDSLLRGQQRQQLLLQTLDLQWQSQLGSNQQFQLASTLWRTDPQQPASATSAQKLEFSEAYWSIDAGNWSLSAGKRKRDFDVNYGLRPLDLFSPTDTLALYTVVAPGVWQAAADWFGADNAWTLLCNQTETGFRRYGQTLPASTGCGARYYQQAGDLEWQALAHFDEDIGWRVGTSQVWVFNEGLALQGSLLWQQHYWSNQWIHWPRSSLPPGSGMNIDRPLADAVQQQGAWQLSTGLNYTHATGWNLLLEYSFDGQASADKDWQHLQQRLQGPTLQALERQSSLQLFSSRQLTRQQWLMHLRVENDWHPTLTLLYQPGVTALLISGAVSYSVSDQFKINLGIKHFAGPADSSFRLLGKKHEVVAGAQYAF
jgi:hypothetical protein